MVVYSMSFEKFGGNPKVVTEVVLFSGAVYYVV